MLCVWLRNMVAEFRSLGARIEGYDVVKVLWPQSFKQ